MGAKAGDRVTDEGGNTICYMAKDLGVGDVVSLDKFERWVGEIPKPDGLVSELGFIKVDGGKWLICIDGEWQ